MEAAGSNPAPSTEFAEEASARSVLPADWFNVFLALRLIWVRPNSVARLIRPGWTDLLSWCELAKLRWSIAWFVLLTFPVWLYWIGASLYGAPAWVYLILILASYYAIIVLAPYLGLPWLFLVMLMVAWRFWKRRRSRVLGLPLKKKGTMAESG